MLTQIFYFSYFIFFLFVLTYLWSAAHAVLKQICSIRIPHSYSTFVCSCSVETEFLLAASGTVHCTMITVLVSRWTFLACCCSFVALASQSSTQAVREDGPYYVALRSLLLRLFTTIRVNIFHRNTFLVDLFCRLFFTSTITEAPPPSLHTRFPTHNKPAVSGTESEMANVLLYRSKILPTSLGCPHTGHMDSFMWKSYIAAWALQILLWF